ncbi:MAG: DHA2 family efflux MFS transporter permease subunit [Desulfomonilaceae bacterium]
MVAISVMIPTLIVALDTSVANVSLTHIQGSLSAGQDEVTWVLTSYIAANATVIPMSGWLSRLLGRKRYLMASVAIFTVSSMLCGAATGLTEIILFRIVQGIGGGGLQPMSQAILLETFPANERGLAVGIFGMGIVIGPILGPLLGGYLTDNYSWRWIFYINVPIGIVALVMIISFVADPHYLQRLGAGDKIDAFGLTLLCLGIGSLQVVLDKGQRDDWFSSDFILVLSIVAVISLVTLLFWELKHENPVLDLKIFTDRSFATSNLIAFFAYFGFFSSIVLLPMYLQTLLGYTAYLAGVVLAAGGTIMIVLFPLVGKITERLDSRLLLAAGLLVTGYSAYYMSGFDLTIDIQTAINSRMILAAGIPFIFVPCSYLMIAYIPKEEMNNASAIYNLLRNLGSSFGIAIVTTLIARRTQFHQSRLSEQLTAYNPLYIHRLHELQAMLSQKLGPFSDPSALAQNLMYKMLEKQATTLAFGDAFYFLAVILFALVGTVWIIRKPPEAP